MILQALYQLAQAEDLIGDADYQRRPVAWLVRVDKDGCLLSIEGTHEIPEQTGKKNPKPRAKRFRIPRQQPSRSGTRAPAEFLVDNALYVFGLSVDGKYDQPKASQRADMFRQKVSDCWQATGDEGVKAVLDLLENTVAGKQAIPLDEAVQPNDLFAFVFAPDVDTLITDRDSVRSYWRQLRRGTSQQGQAVRCLVTGMACCPVDKHPKIKRIPQKGGAGDLALIPLGSPSTMFESYGWKKTENAPVSQTASETCAAALNRLLDSSPTDAQGGELPRRHLRLSADTVVCYWTPVPRHGGLDDFFAALLQANPEEVAELYRAIWRGKAPKMDDPSAFYALTLSGARGRATVRDWIESSVAEVARSLAEHFADLDIVRNTPNPKGGDLPPQLPLRTLLRSLSPRGKDEGIPPALAGQVIRAALRGTVYPLSILQRALIRARAEIGDVAKANTPLERFRAFQARDARAALIKAVLNRRKRFRPDTTAYKEITRAMDPNNEEPGYLLGRLLAVIERMQQLALGDVNASVVDRFFSGASATPGAVFPRLMKNLRHHARKAKDSDESRGRAHGMEREVDKIVAKLQPALGGFPPHLDLQQQGLFIVGYHHMRHWLWMTKEARQAWEAEHAEASASA